MLPQVEEVFMAGDLPRVAEILSMMRKSLSLVSNGSDSAFLTPVGGAEHKYFLLWDLEISGCRSVTGGRCPGVPGWKAEAEGAGGPPAGVDVWMDMGRVTRGVGSICIE